jgi:hypothetical protein
MAIDDYPGRIIEVGETDAGIVSRVQERLVDRGCGPLGVTGRFERDTKAAVQLFQARNVDADEIPLKIDGRIGSLTWGALFGDASVPVQTTTSSPLLAAVLQVAASQIGVREDPPGSNQGPVVDQYLASVGLDSKDDSYPWCAAFVYWCFEQASAASHVANPVTRTASVLEHWRRSPARRIDAADAIEDPALVQPGFIFVLSTGGGAGHTGLVLAVHGGKLVTIEGNTNEGGSREGIGVFQRESRKLADINRGFLDYS